MVCELALAALATGVVAGAGSVGDRLVGTWVKDHAMREGGSYPGDSGWSLEVTFLAEGRFAWRSARTETREGRPVAVDDSLSGRYSVAGVTVTYAFDPPSPDAAARLPEWFAYWPGRQIGQQTLRFDGETLVLVHDAGKLWIHLRRKPSDPR